MTTRQAVMQLPSLLEERLSSFIGPVIESKDPFDSLSDNPSRDGKALVEFALNIRPTWQAVDTDMDFLCAQYNGEVMSTHNSGLPFQLPPPEFEKWIKGVSVHVHPKLKKYASGLVSVEVHKEDHQPFQGEIKGFVNVKPEGGPVRGPMETEYPRQLLDIKANGFYIREVRKKSESDDLPWPAQVTYATRFLPGNAATGVSAVSYSMAVPVQPEGLRPTILSVAALLHLNRSPFGLHIRRSSEAYEAELIFGPGYRPVSFHYSEEGRIVNAFSIVADGAARAEISPENYGKIYFAHGGSSREAPKLGSISDLAENLLKSAVSGKQPEVPVFSQQAF